MNSELKTILDQIKGKIDNFNNGVVKGEEEFINSLKDLNKKLTEELVKPQEGQKKIV